MNRTDLEQALLAAESQQTFRFSPAAFGGDAWSDVRALVTNTLGQGADAGRLVLEGFVKTSSSLGVAYRGTAPALLAQEQADFAQASLAVRALFWLQGGKPQLLIQTTELPAAWTLSASLSGTESSILDEVTFSEARLTLSSVSGADPETGLALSRGVRFEGTIRLAGSFESVSQFLVDSESLRVRGMLEIERGSLPSFRLTAPGRQLMAMRPFPFSLTIGAQLSCERLTLDTPDGEEPTAIVEAALVGTIFLGTGPQATTLPVRMVLTEGDPGLRTFEIDNVTISLSSWEVLNGLTGGADLRGKIPADVPAPGNLVLRELEIAIDTSAPIASMVESLVIDVALSPPHPWNLLPGGGLSLVDLGARFALTPPAREGGASDVQATLHGTFRLGSDEDGTDIALTVTLPDLVVQGTLADDSTIPLSWLLDQFFGRVLGRNVLPPFPNMEVTQLDLRAAPRSGRFAVEAEIDFGWSLETPVLTLTFERLELQLEYDGAMYSGGIAGYLSLAESPQFTDLPGAEDVLFASASTAGDGTWQFEAGTAPGSSIDLLQIVTSIFAAVFPVPVGRLGNLRGLRVTDIRLAMEIGPKALPEGAPPTEEPETETKRYSFAARTDGFWSFTVGGITLGLAAAVALTATRREEEEGEEGGGEPGTPGQLEEPAEPEWDKAGVLTGAVQINNFTLSAAYAFTPENWTVTFQLLYKGRGITAVLYTQRGEEGEPDETLLRISLGTLSVGDIIEYLVNLARPGSDFSLEAPWSVLNSISLKNLNLLVNLTRRTVGIRYEPKTDLGFLSVDALELDYTRGASGKGTVKAKIEGEFLGQRYGGDDGEPLEWDLLDEKPPAVPGKGTGFLDLRYLALGQRVGVPAAAGQDTVQGALDVFKAAMKPVKEPKKNPLLQAGARTLQFDAGSRILFAAELGLIEGTIQLGAILWDPELYGAFIALSGERAGALAGLRFELLYKKVTDDIGVFKVELRIPEAYRQFEFGAVSLTLGVLKLDIFTNGDFRVDLGFPRNGDFTDSFAVQVFPFLGKGGFYFAKLNGQTSTTVPRITNGTFEPVIEAGLGISVGFGKEISRGPLKAGLSITAVAILEGTLAFFHPASPATPKATYYRLQGTAALVGKLYGEVDFYIIKASVSLIAEASVAFIVEAYEPIHLELAVSVSVDASIKILFVRIHFSFRVRLEESFTIGSRSTPPWLVAPPAGRIAERSPRLPLQRRAERAAAERTVARQMRTARQARAERRALTALAKTAAPALDWTRLAVFAAPRTVRLTMLPAFTVAIPARLFGAPANAPTTPAVRGVMMLSVENTVPPAANTAEAAAVVSVAHLPGVATPAAAPFSILAEAMLRWAILAYAGPSAPPLGLAELTAIHDLMESDGTTVTSGFSYTNLKAFLAANLRLDLAGPPAGGTPNDTSATVFPMIPELTMTAPGLAAPVDFSAWNRVDQAYVDNLAAYFRQLRVDTLAPTAGVEGDPDAPGAARKAADLATGESLATVIFRDYFLLLARSAVQAAIELLEQWPHTVAADETLGGVAAALDVAVEAVVIANQELAHLNPATSLPLDGVVVQALASETLGTLAGRFGLAAKLADIGSQNADHRDLLRPGAALAVPSFVHAARAGDDLAFLTAFYLARNGGLPGAGGGPEGEDLAWYAQALVDLNPGVHFDRPFAGGEALVVPAGYRTLGADGQPAHQAYTARPGDTQESIAATFCLLQNRATALEGPKRQLRGANPAIPTDGWAALAAGTAVTIPAQTHTVVDGETLASLAARFALPGSGAGRDDLSAGTLAAANAAADVLAPLAALALPRVTYRIQANDTLAGIARLHNLGLADLALSIAATPNVFRTTYTAGTATLPVVLTVPGVGPRPADEIVAAVLAGPINRIAASVSRFLAHGLRLPDPTDAQFRARAAVASDTVAVRSFGLYDLVGQEFPAPPATTPTTTITFSSSQVPWLTFVATAVAAPGETVKSLSRRIPNLAAENPQLDLTAGIPAGAVLRTGTVTQLTLTLTAAQLAANYPATGLTPTFSTAPTRLALWRELPVRSTFQTVLHWQAAERPALFFLPIDGGGGPGVELQGAGKTAADAGLLAGEPSLWLFPAALLEAAARDVATPYQLVTTPLGRGPEAPETALGLYAWATLVPIRVKALPLPASGAAAGASYLVLGADPEGRQRLLAAWRYLAGRPGEIPGTRLSLLYAPGAANPNPAGLASDALEPGGTYLLKTNLSTETTSGFLSRGQAKTAAAPSGTYYAGLAAPLAFLQRLWEGSVTGTGGYLLHYQARGGGALPAEIFSAEGEATLSLLILLQGQAASSVPERRLLPFNNAAVVVDNVDPGAVNLFAEAADGTGKTRFATVPPGHIGFTAELANPTLAAVAPPTGGGPVATSDAPQTGAQRAAELASFLGFSVTAAGPFRASNLGLPAGPVRPEDGGGAAKWRYRQVVPVAPLALAHPLPASPALPTAADDPYAGIAARGDATLALALLDVFGHETTALAPLPVRVRYVDDVIGVAAWPGLAVAYAVSGAAGAVALDLTFALRAGAYLPGAGQGTAAAAQAAVAHGARYRQIHYQLEQADLQATLATSLDQAAAAAPHAYPFPKHALTDVVHGAYAFLQTAARLAARIHTTAAGDTLAGLAATYGVPAALLLTENRDLAAAALFPGAVAVPVYRTVAHGDTLAGLAAAAGLGVDGLLALADNAAAVVPAGTRIAIPFFDIVTAAGETLAALAARAGTTAGDLARANAGTASLLGDGFPINFEGVRLTTLPGETWSALADRFAAAERRATPAELAAENEAAPGLFLPGKTLRIDRHVVAAATPLAALATALAAAHPTAGITLAALAAANADLPNLLAAGTLLSTGGTTLAPEPAETLADFALAARVPLDRLAAPNLKASLAAGASLRVPLEVAPPDAAAAPAYVPYTLRTGETLEVVAQRFLGTSKPLPLADLNRDVAGVFAGGRSLTVGKKTLTTVEGDSFAALLARFAAQGLTLTLAELLPSVSGSPVPLLRPGAVLLCPLPAVPAGATLASLAATYGVAAADLAAANAALSPFVTAGATLSAGGATTVTGAHDTLAKLALRLGIGVDEMAALAGLTLVAGARFLLPPGAVTASVALRATRALPAAIAPLAVDLTLARLPGGIDDDFAAIDRVRQSTAALHAAGQDDGGALALTRFAQGFEAAFGRRLKLASSRGKTADGRVTRQLYAVDFGTTGIGSVALAGDRAAFFAFRPLSTTLESRTGVPIQPYAPGTGLAPAAPVDYQSVDLEVWVRDFLAAFDLFLSPAYADALFRVPALARQDGDPDPGTWFDRAVAAKKTIAEGLSRTLGPLLTSSLVGSAVAGDLGAAREAVLQKLRIELSSAYATDAVVQVPTDVNSTLPATPKARLAGRPQPVTYVTAGTDGFAEIAAWYGVSPRRVGRFVAGLAGLLAPGRVTWQPAGGTAAFHDVTAEETLADVAAAFGVAVEDLPLALAPAQGAGLFRAGSAIPASRLALAIPAGATFESLTEYFGVEIEELALANERVRGLFAVAEITVDGVTVPVTAADNSLADIAAALGRAGRAISVSELGLRLLTEPGILAPGVTLHAMSPVPAAILSATKLALRNGAGSVNFLVQTPATRDFRSLWLDLDYAANELEFGVETAPDTEGYESSSWLSFVLPLDGADAPPGYDPRIGPVRVPIPLRSYPPPAVLSGQRGSLSVAAPATVAQAKLWTYDFSYQYDEAAQDTLTLSVTFNEPPPSQARDQAPLDPFPPLAQFAAVYPALREDLGLLLDGDLARQPDALARAKAAIRTMVTLVERVAVVWGASEGPVLPPIEVAVASARDAALPPAERTFTYEARSTTRADAGVSGRRHFDKLLLDAVGTGGSAAGRGPNGDFPRVFRLSADAAPEELVRESVSATRAVYRYPTAVDAHGRIEHRLSWDGLDIVAWQSARAGLHVTRNRSLLLPPAPGVAAPATDPAFVYQTPHTALDRMVPFLVQRAEILLPSTGNEAADLARLFADLLGGATGEVIKLSVEMGFELVAPLGGGEGIVSFQPVLFRPPFPFDGDGPGTTVLSLLTALNAWRQERPVPPQPVYRYEVSLFSTLDPGLLRPLLTLADLRYRR